MPTSKPTPRKGLPGEWRMVACVALVAVLLLACFPHRADYAGHYLAGAGATLLLLGFVAAVLGEPSPGTMLFWVLVAVGLGGLCEATVFRLAAYDWADFSVQSMGAVLVAAPLLGAGGEKRQPSGRLGGAALGMLLVAVVLVSV
ncbi:MAG: hypothetical protein ACT4QF_05710 [Sporichthyaceae bacterium]